MDLEERLAGAIPVSGSFIRGEKYDPSPSEVDCGGY